MFNLRQWIDDLRGKPRHALVGRPELWQMKRAFQIDFLRARGLTPQQRVMDIGCGSLRGGAALIAYLDAGNYTGIDVRENVMAEARAELARERLADKQPQLVLAAQGLQAVSLHERYDMIWSFSVLFHMSDPIVDTCIALVARQLKNDGVFYANVILGQGEPGHWQGFPVMARSLETYQALAQQYGLTVEVLGRLDDLGHNSGDASQDSQIMLAFRQG